MRCQLPSIIRATLAEFIGTYVLVVIGNGSIAQSFLAPKDGENAYFIVNWGWALGCSLGILLSANTSGGHLNPAVTMALVISRDFSWKKLPAYWLAQYFGALAASATVLGVYYEKIIQSQPYIDFFIGQNNDTEPEITAIFANNPSQSTMLIPGLVEEILSSAIFMLVICVTTNKKYSKVPNHLQPIYIGFTLLAAGVAYGSNGGYALNPARDLAPRFVSYLAGWGTGAFSAREFNWFWIFLVGPHIGAILGVSIFHLVLLETEQIGTDGSNNKVARPSVVTAYSPDLNCSKGFDFRLPSTRNVIRSRKSRPLRRFSVASSIV